MDDNLVDISFLIEGTHEQLSTSISYNSNGGKLRERIYAKACRELVYDYEDLTILKVRTTVPFQLSNRLTSFRSTWSLTGPTYPYCGATKAMTVSKKYLRGKR
jgi:hypothetical protein